MNKIFKNKKLWIGLALLLLLGLALYFYTYFFSADSEKVIYQDAQRRIYLVNKKNYARPDRELWNMVYEDQKTGNRWFILGNSKKGYPNKKMAQIVLNTVDKGQMKSFDLVQGAGVTLRKSTTDIHSNIIDKKTPSDVWNDMEKSLAFDPIV